MEPTIATVITNPTNRDLKYAFLAKNGMYVKAGASVTLPYDVFTAASSGQRAQLGQALKTKMVRMSYISRLTVESVKTVPNGVVHGKAAVPAKEAPQAAPAPAPKEEPKDEPKKPRDEIIVATGEGKDAVKDSEDLVQKFTGQETTTMRDAMGWEAPPTDDPRTPQEAEVVKMNEAVTENIGDPEEKAAAAAAKEAAAKKTTEKAVDPKKSAAAKKAAATRKANAAKKKAAGKK